MTRLHIASVCVNYGDFLCHTLPTWRPLSPDLTVLTSPADTETQEICRANGVEFHATEVWYQRGDQFNKGQGIRDLLTNWKRGRKHLFDGQHWLLLLDADTWLPPFDLSGLLDGLDANCIYGAVRRHAPRYEEFQAAMQSSDWSQLRREDPIAGCKVVWGFFQLCNLKRLSEVLPGLYITHRNAAASDVRTSLRFGYANQRLLPVEVLHLGYQVYNWNGRFTHRYEPGHELLPPVKGPPNDKLPKRPVKA